MINRFSWIIPAILICFIIQFALWDSDFEYFDEHFRQKAGDVFFEYLPAYDTLYYLGNNYVLLSLKEQKTKLISRKDSTIVFKISSGNQDIKLGKSTPEGLFTVQNKTPMAISKQFNNAELFNWIGFNGNVGFHGLKGTGYYSQLGFRPSSHGCVRISREDGQMLYQSVHVGTPVFVIREKPVRVIKFANWGEYNPEKDYIIDGLSTYNSKLLNRRIFNIYEGKALSKNNFKVFMTDNCIFRYSRVFNGDTSKIPLRQKEDFVIHAEYFLTKDNIKISDEGILTDTCKIDFK